MNLRKIISSGESETVEFKASPSMLDEIVKTVVAFTNTRGGTIIVGVGDDGRVLGVSVGRGTVEKLVNGITSSTDPKVYPKVRVSRLDGKDLILIEVEEGFNKPYLYKGRAYRRVGRSNVQLGRNELERLIFERYGLDKAFDSSPIDTSLTEIDEEKVKEFVRLAKGGRAMNISYTSLGDVLSRLNLMKDERPTRAAILLFGKDPQRYIPYAIVKAGRFRAEEIIDDKVIEGDLREQIEGSLIFIKGHIKKGILMTGDAKREDRWEYPLEAIREAMVNALTHRDYAIPSPVYLKVYDDRIEVTNPGGLPDPLTVEDLRREHPSVLRNPTVGRALYLMGYIEQWGTGTNRMIKACREAGLAEPEFIDEGGWFKVVLKGNRVEDMLNERQSKLLKLIRERGYISRREYQLKLNINERTARMDIERLLQLGLIRKVGSGKNVRYALAR